MADGNITLYVTTQKAQEELARMLAENAALKRDLQYARDGLTKGRTRMREDNERMKSALQRLADWGGLPGCDHYSGTIAADVMAWVRGGMAGPLPPLPEWAQGMGPNVEVSGCLRAPMPEDAPRTAAGSPLDRPVGPLAGA